MSQNKRNILYIADDIG